MSVPAGLQVITILGMSVLSIVICTTVATSLPQPGSASDPTTTTGSQGPATLGPTGNAGQTGATTNSSTGPTGQKGDTGPAGNPNTLNDTATGAVGPAPDGPTGTTGDIGPTGFNRYTPVFGLASLQSGGVTFVTGNVLIFYGPNSPDLDGPFGIWASLPINWGPISPLPPNGPLTISLPYSGQVIRTPWPVGIMLPNRSPSKLGTQVVGRAVVGAELTIEILITDPTGVQPAVAMELNDILDGGGALNGGTCVTSFYYPTR